MVFDWMVVWLDGRLVCHNILKGQEVTLPCSYWSTCINYAQILSLFSTIEAQQLELCETGPLALRVNEKGGTPSKHPSDLVSFAISS